MKNATWAFAVGLWSVVSSASVPAAAPPQAAADAFGTGFCVLAVGIQNMHGHGVAEAPDKTDFLIGVFQGCDRRLASVGMRHAELAPVVGARDARETVAKALEVVSRYDRSEYMVTGLECAHLWQILFDAANKVGPVSGAADEAKHQISLLRTDGAKLGFAWDYFGDLFLIERRVNAQSYNEAIPYVKDIFDRLGSVKFYETRDDVPLAAIEERGKDTYADLSVTKAQLEARQEVVTRLPGRVPVKIRLTPNPRDGMFRLPGQGRQDGGDLYLVLKVAESVGSLP